MLCIVLHADSFDETEFMLQYPSFFYSCSTFVIIEVVAVQVQFFNEFRGYFGGFSTRALLK